MVLDNGLVFPRALFACGRQCMRPIAQGLSVSIPAYPRVVRRSWQTRSSSRQPPLPDQAQQLRARDRPQVPEQVKTACLPTRLATPNQGQRRGAASVCPLPPATDLPAIPVGRTLYSAYQRRLDNVHPTPTRIRHPVPSLPPPLQRVYRMSPRHVSPDSAERSDRTPTGS